MQEILILLAIEKEDLFLEKFTLIFARQTSTSKDMIWKDIISQINKELFQK